MRLSLCGLFLYWLDAYILFLYPGYNYQIIDTRCAWVNKNILNSKYQAYYGSSRTDQHLNPRFLWEHRRYLLSTHLTVIHENVSVLGITLDDSLKFDLHIADMCKKASRQINALKRVSKFSTQDSRKSIYRSFIAANFNYRPISWIFCGKKNTTKLEKLQERALRLQPPKTATYDDLLKRGNFLSLKAFRTRCLAVEVYKCVHGLNPTYLNDLFNEPLANYNFRDKCRRHQPQFHTYTYGFRSFKYSGSKLWNSLPRAIKNTNDINEFKKNITEWCQTCDLSKLEIFWCPFLFQIQAITMYPFVTFTGVVY